MQECACLRKKNVFKMEKDSSRGDLFYEASENMDSLECKCGVGGSVDDLTIEPGVSDLEREFG